MTEQNLTRFKIANIICRNLYDSDRQYDGVCMECAEDILKIQPVEPAVNMEALDAKISEWLNSGATNAQISRAICKFVADQLAEVTEIPKPVEKIQRVLSKVMTIIEGTYGHDDDGERDEDLPPDNSAADTVEYLTGIEGSIEDALELIKVAH